MIPITDCVNSISGKVLPNSELGLNTPKRSAPLANGGRTNGIITTICIRKLPWNLYLDKQYARGTPNKPINIVEIDAVIKLRTKVSITSGLVNEVNNVEGSTKVEMLNRG